MPRHPLPAATALTPPRRAAAFDPLPFLARIRAGRSSRTYFRHEGVFAQGEAADAVFYIEAGKVTLSVVSARGKKAVVGTLGRGSFFGEGCLAGQSHRTSTARAAVACRISRVAKKTMLRLLHREPDLAALFMGYLLARNAHIEGQLVQQLFNTTEKRLAQLLLRLAQFGKQRKPLTVIPRISLAGLASMVGTSPAKVGRFMERFKELGFIEYDGDGLAVQNALLTVVLRK